MERTDDKGIRLVYLRVRLTGMLPRIVGPFASREIALWCLDELISEIEECMDCSASNMAQDHIMKRPFHRRINLILVEDPLIVGASPAGKAPFQHGNKKQSSRKRKVA